MTFRGFVSRSEIGLVKPRSVSYNIAPEKGGVAGHYAGGPINVRSHSDCLAKWRGWQKYHMYTKGWVDIAYTCGVCDHGYVLAGRGAGVRTAANGTNDGNYRYYAVQWIGGSGETPTRDAVDAFWWAVKSLQEQGGAGQSVKRHSDFKSTSCPGNLGAVIDAGPSASTGIIDEQGEIMLQRGDKGNAVSVFQQALLKWKSDILPKYGADADFGGETETAVKKYQAAADVPATGKIDGVTAALLGRYVAKVSGGGTASHTHSVTADPKLTVGGNSTLGKELAKHLAVHGILHTGPPK